MNRLKSSATTIALMLAGCPAESSPADDETVGVVSATDPSSGVQTSSAGMSEESSSSTTADSGSSSSSGDSASGPPKYDLGIIPDAPVPADAGCKGIDFLFVIDNSGSMGAQQGQLLASFPGFITAIENSLENVSSYHVGVITSDNYTSNEPGCTTIGDLVTQTQAGGVCGPFEEGHRFATQQDDLQEVFPCIANVGTFGSPIEQPVTGLVAALDPDKADPGECNEDFIREDSILVVVIVTDDPPYIGDFDDAHPDTDTSGWHDAVLEAKGGNPEALVIIGFIPWENITCVPLTLESPNLINFVDSFGDQGIKASICEPDFGPIFTETIETIQFTCDNFIPQG